MSIDVNQSIDKEKVTLTTQIYNLVVYEEEKTN